MAENCRGFVSEATGPVDIKELNEITTQGWVKSCTLQYAEKTECVEKKNYNFWNWNFWI